MSSAREEDPRQKNVFFRDSYSSLLMALIIAIFLVLTLVGVVFYQFFHRPLPQFNAVATNGQVMELTSVDQPNLLAETLLRWASQAAVAAYTFDFVNYNNQMALAHPYFTDLGWIDYQNSLSGLIQRITANQLIVSSVVSGTPVISNQGELPRVGYAWRVQMPFLVTYQSADAVSQKGFTVIMTIIRVPTWKNPAAIGIDQFLMV